MPRSTTIRAWPFLVSTDATHGFTTVVAPQFMVEAGVADVLRNVTDGEVTPPGMAYLLPVTGLPTGALLIAYRISVAPGALVDSQDEILYDYQGRRILLVEGMVVEALDGADLALTEEDFRQAREACRAAFRRLWAANDELPVQPSTAFGVSKGGETRLQLVRRAALHFTGTPACRPPQAPSPAPPAKNEASPPSLTDPHNLLMLLFVLGGIASFLLLAMRLLSRRII